MFVETDHALNEDEQEGITMIQGLQLLVGRIEDRETALRGWRAMTRDEQLNTKIAYHYMCEGGAR